MFSLGCSGSKFTTFKFNSMIWYLPRRLAQVGYLIQNDERFRLSILTVCPTVQAENFQACGPTHRATDGHLELLGQDRPALAESLWCHRQLL